MINHLRDGFGVEPVCRELDLSVSAFNARRRRPKSARRLRDEQLINHVRRITPLPARPTEPAASTASSSAKVSPPPAAPSSV